LEYEETIKGGTKNGVNCFDRWIMAWEKSGVAKIKELRPDIVIDDMVARCGAIAAEELGVPVVFNFIAGPLRFAQEIGLAFKIPNFSVQASNWFGKI